jgi:hypothetical protein
MIEALSLWRETSGDAMKDFNAVCRWLEVHIYDKIFGGESIAFKTLPSGGAGSFMDRLLEIASQPEEA